MNDFAGYFVTLLLTLAVAAGSFVLGACLSPDLFEDVHRARDCPAFVPAPVEPTYAVTMNQHAPMPLQGLQSEEDK